MPEGRIEIELEDGALDACVAWPDGAGRRPPVLLLPDRGGLTAAVESDLRRLAAHDFFALAPDLSGRSAEERREAMHSCVDFLADERRVDDARIGVVGFGAGADLGLALAGARAERIAAVAAYGGRGLSPRAATEIAQRINAFVRLGYTVGVTSARAGLLETALGRAGVLFDVEISAGEPDWPDLIELFNRTLGQAGMETSRLPGVYGTSLNP